MGYSKGGDSKSKNTSTTVFPGEFLPAFESRYGRGVSIDELLGALPQGQSIFGSGGPIAGAGGQTAQLPGGASAGGGAVPYDVINSLVAGQFAGQPQQAAQIMERIRAAGGQGSTGVTADQLQAYFGHGGAGGAGPAGQWAEGQLPALLQQFQQAPIQRFGQPGQVDLSALQIPESIQRMFGAQATPNYATPTIRDPNAINAASAQAGLMDVPGGNFDAYQQSIYRSLIDPVQRTLTQQGDVADRQLQAELAQSGLASSGSGVGQLQQQRRQRSEQMMAAAQQAADQASQQRFGAEYQQRQFNAQQQQAVNLANAGFDQDAQKQNAANILAGDTARSDAYLKTLGLNQQAAQAMRADFLSLLGLTQKELDRLDTARRSSVETALNNWLQQGAVLGNLGQRGTQKSSSSGGSGGGLTITGQGSTT